MDPRDAFLRAVKRGGMVPVLREVVTNWPVSAT
jgi:hypothetical protein